MRILIDTNIFIGLEDFSVLNEKLGELDRIHRENDIQLLVHPLVREEIQRDKQQDRKIRALSRVQRYPELENPPDCSERFLNYGIEDKNPNDRVDNALLSAVYGDAVSFLVTEDRGIHRKGKRLGIDERVFRISEAYEYLKNIYSIRPVVLPNIKEVAVHEIRQYLETPFFDSLRTSYGAEAFDKWFKKAAQDGRRAWFCQDDQGNIGAVCIYKDEVGEVVTVDKRGFEGKVLKLCCVKVGETVRGRKIGELFLKAAFRHAMSNQQKHIYLTLFAEHLPQLVELCEEFGFEYFGKKGNGEDVYFKEHPIVPPESTLGALEYHRKFAPHFKCNDSVAKFLVPIRPEYHDRLFPDCYPERGFQQTLFNIGAALGESFPGNAIKQAYLCNANTRNISPGDILLFYRSVDHREITTIAIVEFARHFKDTEEILKWVAKRTVYNRDEIDRLAKNDCLTILFRLACHFALPVSHIALQEYGVRGNIQSIRKIEDEAFNQIYSKSGLKNCLYAD
jgi:predicted nucleic acid-binding protein